MIDQSERGGSGGLNQLGRDVVAPFSKRGLPILLTGAAIAAFSYPLRKAGSHEIGGDQPLGNRSSIGYQLGLWKVNLAYFASYLGYGLFADDSEALRKSGLMFRATAYTGLVTTGIKAFHLEQRPRRNGDFNSFPSGHASNAFAFAGVIYRNHGPVAGTAAFAMAGFVGLSRLNDNAHYIHDVIFGGALGLSYALGLDSSWSNAGHTKSVAAVPLVGSGGYGVATVFDF